MTPARVTLIRGDGIGPEVTDAAMQVMEAAGAQIRWDEQPAGKAAVKSAGTPIPDALLRSSPYLLGDRFTRADLTLAALLSPLFQPAQHPISWYTLPESLIAFREQFAGRPTSDHVLRMYREHRAE